MAYPGETLNQVYEDRVLLHGLPFQTRRTQDTITLIPIIDSTTETILTENNTDGLSDETISMYLNTRTCEDEEIVQKNARDVQERDICAICQEDLYKRSRVIARVDSGHEYHDSCIREWLYRKNVCPLCNAIALSMEDEEHRQLLKMFRQGIESVWHYKVIYVRMLDGSWHPHTIAIFP